MSKKAKEVEKISRQKANLVSKINKRKKVIAVQPLSVATLEPIPNQLLTSTNCVPQAPNR